MDKYVVSPQTGHSFTWHARAALILVVSVAVVVIAGLAFGW